MRVRTVAAVAAGVLALTSCSVSSGPLDGAAPTRASEGATGSSATASPAVTGNVCPMALDASEADFYPVQPSFSAGYTMSIQKLDSTTASWAYEISGDFPYSQWMAWYLYDIKGVPLFKFSDTAITADSGSTNPYVPGNKILATPRSYHIYLMPSTTPSSVVSSMQSAGKNVTLLPASSTTSAVSIVSRSYWSFSNDNLGSYDRFGYHGPTNTPTPTISAFLTDPTTGELTSTPVDNCGASSDVPQKIWYDASTNSPIITFKDAPVPTQQELADIPHFSRRPGPAAAASARSSRRHRWRARCSSTATSPAARRTRTCSRPPRPATPRTSAAAT